MHPKQKGAALDHVSFQVAAPGEALFVLSDVLPERLAVSGFAITEDLEQRNLIVRGGTDDKLIEHPLGEGERIAMRAVLMAYDLQALDRQKSLAAILTAKEVVMDVGPGRDEYGAIGTQIMFGDRMHLDLSTDYKVTYETTDLEL